jgi:hypothetical protein
MGASDPVKSPCCTNGLKIGISEPIRIVNRHYHSPQGMVWSYRACQSIRKLMQCLACPWSAAQLDRAHLPSAQLSSNLLLNLLKQNADDLQIVDYLKFFLKGKDKDISFIHFVSACTTLYAVKRTLGATIFSCVSTSHFSPSPRILALP